jgi:hypothetical protein
MIMKHARFVAALFALALLAGLGPTCGEERVRAIDGYVALVPQVLGSGQREAVSLSLFTGDRLASGEATVALVKDGQTLIETSARVPGKGTVEFGEGGVGLQVGIRAVVRPHGQWPGY